jgi:CubicO group peptidase (beta-lactamase class C family)
MPMGPRTCAWGGYGGSLVVSDLDAKVTVAYVMNRMEAGLLGDPRGASVVTAAVMSLAAA